MTVLSSMNDAEFAKYLAVAIPDYAQGKVASGQWTATESQELSRKAYADLLPQGLETPDNFLFTVHEGEALRALAWSGLPRKTAAIDKVENLARSNCEILVSPAGIKNDSKNRSQKLTVLGG